MSDLHDDLLPEAKYSDEEMAYARTNGSAALLAKLKEAGVYPYSDMDRTPVV